MTFRRIELDGPAWQLREALGETWRWYVDAPLRGAGNNVGAAAGAAALTPGWWPASVPGSVITDLARAGELPDPYRERNTRAAEWTGDRSWVYRRAVTVPDVDDGERLVLELDGVDPSGTVFWDGEVLGRIAGLYRRGRFTVPAVPGDHRLAVVLDRVPASQPQVGRTELVRVHRPRMNEGWDFCPRFPHQGIWRGVRLLIAPVLLADVTARTEADGRVFVSAALEPPDAAARVEVADPGGRLVADGTITDGRVELAVPDPQLWWPRGLGPPTLYTLRVLVDGVVQWRRPIGFRRAEVVANAGAPADASAYTAVVNGQTVPLVGWNWVPADAQYGAVAPARVRYLVELAARSGARVLRVWGGGLVETEEFYAACDEAGLLVWQEFSQSGSGMQSAPASDAEFARYLSDEAAVIVPSRTHHPSLLLWCGGNELDAGGVPLDESRSPALAALRDTVHRLDPGRAWRPTSPSGPGGRDDVHGPWEHQGLRAQHELYDAGSALAHTEFGVEGMTNRSAVDRLIPAGRQWPADRSNPLYRHLGEWWNNAPLVQESFGHRLTDVDALRRASQLLQATGLAYAVEADRRRFPRCSIVLPWQFNESYPNAWCTSSVEHSGTPKPAYFAVARAFARRRVTIKTPTSVWAGESAPRAEAWVWDEDGAAAGSRVVARLRGADGQILGAAEWTVTGAVEHPVPVGTLTVDAAATPRDVPVVWEAAWFAADGAELDREAVLASTGADFAPLLDLEPAVLHVDVDPGQLVVTHCAGPLVVGLQLADARPGDVPAMLGGDPRPLLPGERRRFAVDTLAPTRLLLEGWNIDAVYVDASPKENTG